ncbi:MAG: NUMOD4 motif-containing HNH endonuclease [Gammaproteobacteria bacterium]|nr:NUMOD4 motif-containing HNH endonuclease [Gammaproteobacteria bacterium]
MEKWTDVKGYEGLYIVSNMGNIKSLKGNIKRLKPFKGTCGYYSVKLYKNGCKKTLSVARIVGEAFIYKKCVENEINHINGIKCDNRSENLEWITHSKNIRHAYFIGLMDNSGENNPSSKITKKQAKEIMCLKGIVPQKEIAIMYNISRSNVANIHCGLTWKII